MANEKRLIPFGSKCPLDELPCGTLFAFGDDCIALKSEYRCGNGLIEAHIIDSGEQFWGGAKNAIEQNALMVQPFRIVDVDAVEVADMKEFAKDVAYQFGYYCQNEGRLHITHGGLSTLEWAFDILGWENPHPVPECECEVEGCHEHATCGTPTADGYKRMCGKHYRNHCAKMDGDGNG